MQYLSELPEIGSIEVDGNFIELQLEQEIEKLPEQYHISAISPQGDHDPVVLTARHAGQIVVVVGQAIEHENISEAHIGGNDWCRMKIKGSSVTFTI